MGFVVYVFLMLGMLVIKECYIKVGVGYVVYYFLREVYVGGE